jgi:tectonic-1/3
MLSRSLVLPVWLVAWAAAASGNTFFMPPGCVCKKSGSINDKTCDAFDCTCSCDLTVGACDLNCCCDKDCGDHSFQDCVDGGSPPPVVKMCVEEASALESINLKYPFRISDSPEDQLQGLVCIEKDNSPVKGVFFEDHGYPRAMTVFSPGSRVAKPIGFHSYDDTTDESYGTYQLGDKIAAYTLSDQQLFVPGYLMLPSDGDGGHCIDSNAALFGQSERNSCYRRTNDLASECETKFNIDRYVSNIFVEKEKGSMIMGTHATDGIVEISIDNKPSTKWDEASVTCRSALKSLRYNVVYNQKTIIDVSVDVETVNISIGSADLIKQDFGVEFIPAAVKQSNQTQQKIVRPRSGNPGYTLGMPTLGAVESLAEGKSNESYLTAQRTGFTVMDTGAGGQCSSSSPTRSTVGFGKDIFVGCTQFMTRHELKEFCTSELHSMLLQHEVGESTFYFPTWLETKQDFLGIFGNADPLDKEQWVKIESALSEPSFSVKSRIWLDAENRCVGMPSRLRIEILWTHVGNVDSPQAKILR